VIIYVIIKMLRAPRQQIILIAISTIIAAFSLASIVNFTNPFEASWLTLLFFYLSLFLFSLGSLTLLGLTLRKWTRQGIYVNNLTNSFRQALLFSIFIVVSFLLMANGLFFWWVEVSLILFLLFVEIFLNLKV